LLVLPTWGFILGLFGNQPRSQQDSVDRYLAQGEADPRAVLRTQPGEFLLRVHGQTKYAVIREMLFSSSQRAGLNFWQGKVYLETRLVPEWGNTTKTIFVILFNDVPIGEISEFDLKAKDLLDFSHDANYYGRAVIQDDLIGNIVNLFIDPVNRLS
jgi:hypothetical protein